MIDLLDVDLNDPELMTEIRLVGDLMVASLESDGALDPGVIDRILGVGWPARRCA